MLPRLCPAMMLAVCTTPGSVDATCASGMAKGMAHRQPSGSDVLLSDGEVIHSTTLTAPRIGKIQHIFCCAFTPPVDACPMWVQGGWTRPPAAAQGDARAAASPHGQGQLTLQHCLSKICKRIGNAPIRRLLSRGHTSPPPLLTPFFRGAPPGTPFRLVAADASLFSSMWCRPWGAAPSTHQDQGLWTSRWRAKRLPLAPVVPQKTVGSLPCPIVGRVPLRCG
jgi:hypothetical protein